MTADLIAMLSPRANHLRGFVEYFEEELLSSYLLATVAAGDKCTVVKPDGRLGLRKDPAIDFGKYVRDAHGQADGAVYDNGQSRALLGALYMPKCNARVVEGLRKALVQIRKASATKFKAPPNVFWVIPDSELWGRTSLVRGLLDGLRAVLKEALDTPLDIVGIAPCRQDIPWHVTAFHKDYKMTDPDNTDSKTLLRAAEIGREAGLRYVYAGICRAMSGNMKIPIVRSAIIGL